MLSIKSYFPLKKKTLIWECVKFTEKFQEYDKDHPYSLHLEFPICHLAPFALFLVHALSLIYLFFLNNLLCYP